MKKCNGCKHAEWARTKSGGLHPSGRGRCRYVVKKVAIPASMYWIGSGEPRPCGGYINRRDEFNDHCPCYEREMNDTEVSPANSSELPHSSSHVRSWKRWGYINDDGGNAGTAFYEFCHKKHHRPVTIIEGHDAVERIEREAYRMGEKYGYDNGLAAGMEACRGGDTLAIDGVEPVVVNAWTHDDKDMCDYPWTHIDDNCGWVVSAWRAAGDECNTPCRVHIYPGIGKDWKRVKE